MTDLSQNLRQLIHQNIMKIDIKKIANQARNAIPGLIGGIHFINGKRQIEYKIVKKKESFNYRVRVTINQFESEQEIVNRLYKLIKKGLKLYKNHITVVQFRTLYDYECIMMPSQIKYDSVNYSYGSGYRDYSDEKKYRQFSVKKYGPKLAYNLAKLNTFLAKNPKYIQNFKIKHSQYVDQKEHSLNIRINFPEISFLYISYITTNINSIDPRIHFILADKVCDFALNMMKQMHTVVGLPLGITCYKYKDTLSFQTSIWNEKTKKWTSRFRSVKSNADAYQQILEFRITQEKTRPRMSKIIKMEPVHYELVKAIIKEFLKNKKRSIHELRSEYVSEMKPEGQMRWALFQQVLTGLEKQGINPEELFDYLSDTHIDNALKNIIKELSSEIFL